MFRRALALSHRAELALLVAIGLAATVWLTVAWLRRRAKQRQAALSSAPPPADVAPLRAVDGGARRS